jgi:predicted transposase/invertase (TIGR01784 family)
MSHDQRFKEFLRTFFRDFLKLFYPDVEARLDFDGIEFSETELFTDFPEGKRREADVVAKLTTLDGSPELVLIHVEIQSRPERDFEARMFEYYALLWSRYKVPIFPIVLYLHGGNTGVSHEQYRMQLFGREVLRFRYESIRLERLNAEEYLRQGSPVGAALAALMDRSSSGDIEGLRAWMMQCVVTSELDEARQFLLVNIIQTYFELSKEQIERYQLLIARKEYQKVQDVDLTWMDKLLHEGEEKGRLSGKRETLLRLLAQKFGPLPEGITTRIEAFESVEQLDACLERILVASSLEEMGFAV